MPTLIQGFGSAFIGQRDFRPDGSYLTTEWFCFGVPLFPLDSFRVIRGGAQHPWYGRSETAYTICEKRRIDWRQALCTYIFMVCYTAWIVLVGFQFFEHSAALKRYSDTLFTGAFAVIVFGTPWIIPLALRARARRGVRL